MFISIGLLISIRSLRGYRRLRAKKPKPDIGFLKNNIVAVCILIKDVLIIFVTYICLFFIGLSI